MPQCKGLDRSFVRLHYKAFDMGLLAVKFDRPLPSGKEMIAESHKVKIEEMVGWEANPFRKFRVLPTGQSKKAFKLAPIHKSKCCKICPTRGNSKCKFECCRGCCVKKQDTYGLACKAHKVKLDSGKKKAAPAVSSSEASEGPPKKKRRRKKHQVDHREEDESDEEEEHQEEEDESDEEEMSYEEEEEEETGSDTMQIESVSSKKSSDSESEGNINPCANSVLIALDVGHTCQMLRTRSCAAIYIQSKCF
jgi:hypothetical protein